MINEYGSVHSGTLECERNLQSCIHFSSPLQPNKEMLGENYCRYILVQNETHTRLGQTHSHNRPHNMTSTLDLPRFKAKGFDHEAIYNTTYSL